MLSRQKELFSEVFYARHRQHVIRGLSWCAILLTISGTTAANLWTAIYRGEGNVVLTSVVTAIFFWLIGSAYLSVPDLFHVRLLPYFERRLGGDGAETWMGGEHLLSHSRRLDAAATQFGVQPLSKFASGDDMVPGEKLCWFSAEEGLRTVERLTQPDVTSFPAEVISDLVSLRDALRLASDEQVQFCLLLREGSSVSGLEMDQRRGSFF